MKTDMPDWIKEAEKKHKKKIKEQENLENYDNQIIADNHKKLEPLISELNELTDRLAQINPEARKPSLEIGHTHLEGDNRYEYYGSAIITKNKRQALLVKKNIVYLFWRRVYITTLDEEGYIRITFYVKYTNETNKKDAKRKKTKFKVKIDKVGPKLINAIIEWIAYRKDYNDIKKYIPASSK